MCRLLGPQNIKFLKVSVVFEQNQKDKNSKCTVWFGAFVVRELRNKTERKFLEQKDVENLEHAASEFF